MVHQKHRACIALCNFAQIRVTLTWVRTILENRDSLQLFPSLNSRVTQASQAMIMIRTSFFIFYHLNTRYRKSIVQMIPFFECPVYRCKIVLLQQSGTSTPIEYRTSLLFRSPLYTSTKHRLFVRLAMVEFRFVLIRESN